MIASFGAEFTVVTDHSPNTFFSTKADLSPRQTRWSERLSRFQFTWEYRPGRVNVADSLSRHPSFTAVADQQSLSQISTPPAFYANRVLATAVTAHLTQLSLALLSLMLTLKLRMLSLLWQTVTC